LAPSTRAMSLDDTLLAGSAHLFLDDDDDDGDVEDGSNSAPTAPRTAPMRHSTLVHQPPDQRAAKLSLAPRLQASFEAGDAAWTAGRLQTELSSLLAAEGLRGLDVLKAWDAEGENGAISKKEYLMALKSMCGGGTEQWYALARDAAVQAFLSIDVSGDRSVSASELCRWLDPHGRLISAGRKRASQRAIGTARAPLQSLASDDSNTATNDEDQTQADPALAYSPTKLSTRIAQVRAFDPCPPDSLAAMRKRRRPLWAPKEVPEAVVGPVLLNGKDVSKLRWRQPSGRAVRSTTVSDAAARGHSDDDVKEAAAAPPATSTSAPPSARVAPKPPPMRPTPTTTPGTAASGAVVAARPSPRLVTRPRVRPQSARAATVPRCVSTNREERNWYDHYLALAKERHAAQCERAAAAGASSASASTAPLPASARSILPWSALTRQVIAEGGTVRGGGEPSQSAAEVTMGFPAGGPMQVSVTPLTTPRPSSMHRSAPTLNSSMPRQPRLARPVSAPFRTEAGGRMAAARGAMVQPAATPVLHGGVVALLSVSPRS